MRHAVVGKDMQSYSLYSKFAGFFLNQQHDLPAISLAAEFFFDMYVKDVTTLYRAFQLDAQSDRSHCLVTMI